MSITRCKKGPPQKLCKDNAVRLTLDDSDNTICVRQANTRGIDEEFVINAVKKQAVLKKDVMKVVEQDVNVQFRANAVVISNGGR